MRGRGSDLRQFLTALCLGALAGAAAALLLRSPSPPTSSGDSGSRD